MKKTIAALSFQLWIGLGKSVIMLVDGLRRHGGGALRPGSRRAFASGSRRLVASLFRPTTAPCAAVLIFHGIGDRMEYWAAAQQHLLEHGVASLLFHYSGHAGSSGALTLEHLREDAHSASAFLRAQLPPDTPVFLLGFSLGSGLAIEVIAELAPPPAGVILAQPFTSLRLAAAQVARPLRMLRYFLPDVWQTANNIHRRTQPLLIVHSDGDRLFPVSMGREIYAAASVEPAPPAQLVVPHGYQHNAIYLQVPPDYWQPILDFIGRNSASVIAT